MTEPIDNDILSEFYPSLVNSSDEFQRNVSYESFHLQEYLNQIESSYRPETWSPYAPSIGYEYAPTMAVPCPEQDYRDQENWSVIPDNSYQTSLATHPENCHRYGSNYADLSAMAFPENAHPNQENSMVIPNNGVAYHTSLPTNPENCDSHDKNYADLSTVAMPTLPPTIPENYNDIGFVENRNYQNQYHGNNGTEYSPVRNEENISQVQTQDPASGYQNSLPVQDGITPTQNHENNNEPEIVSTQNDLLDSIESSFRKTKCIECHRTFSRRNVFIGNAKQTCRDCQYTARAIHQDPEDRRCSNGACRTEFKVWPYNHPITKKKICHSCYMHFKKYGTERTPINNPGERRWKNSKKGKFTCANDSCGAQTSNPCFHPVTQKKICSKCFENVPKNGARGLQAKTYKKREKFILSECDNKGCGVMFDYLPRHHPVTGKAICRPCCEHFQECGTERQAKKTVLG